jgi:N-acetylglucosamine-6-sulfatase
MPDRPNILYIGAHYGIRTDRWKLTFFCGMPLDAKGAVAEQTPAAWEPYDVKNDPFELKNLYNDPACADVIRTLRRRLDEVKREYGDTDERYPALMKLREECE